MNTSFSPFSRQLHNDEKHLHLFVSSLFLDFYHPEAKSFSHTLGFSSRSMVHTPSRVMAVSMNTMMHARKHLKSCPAHTSEKLCSFGILLVLLRSKTGNTNNCCFIQIVQSLTIINPFFFFCALERNFCVSLYLFPLFLCRSD